MAVLILIWPTVAQADRVTVGCGSGSSYHNFELDFSRSVVTHGEQNQIDSANNEIRTYNRIPFRMSNGFAVWSVVMPHGATFEFALDTQNWELRDRERGGGAYTGHWGSPQPCNASRLPPE
jgi:hypothetical protein